MTDLVVERTVFKTDMAAKLHGFSEYTFAHGEAVIAMTEFKGRLIVATNSCLYEVDGKRLIKLRLERFDEDA